MSVKLFTLQLFGKLKSAEQIEARRYSLLSDYHEFLAVDQSDELKEFYNLEKFVNSGEFKDRMKAVKSDVFRGSLEYNQLKEYEKLKKSKNVRDYFSLSDSADLKKFKALKHSDKLKEYYELEEYVSEGQFKKDKLEIQSQVFRGSVEAQHLIDFRKLLHDSGIKAWLQLHNSDKLREHIAFAESEKLRQFVELRDMPEKDKQAKVEFKKYKKDLQIRDYFRFENSKKLRLYHEIRKSHLLARYKELKKYTESESFLARKKFLEDKSKFERSEAFQKFQKFRALKNDTDIQFFLGFEKSRIYKNYLDTKDSFDLKRYHELTEITASEKFLQRKAYLEDSKKWEKTEDYAKQQKYLEMKKFPHLIKYFGYLGKPSFDFFKTWEVSFEDHFGGNETDRSKWIPNSYWANKLLGTNYSSLGDLQYFTDGRNLKTGDNGLSVIVKKEKADGIIWKTDAGFVPAEFDFTSGIMATGESFWQKEGIFEVKVKFNPVREIASTISLRGENNQMQINLFEQGVKNRAGVLKAVNEGKPEFTGFCFGNLKKDQHYIFTLLWDNSTLKWTINDREVYRIAAGSIDEPVHINIASVVVFGIPESRLPSGFEIEWIKCYRKIEK